MDVRKTGLLNANLELSAKQNCDLLCFACSTDSIAAAHCKAALIFMAGKLGIVSEPWLSKCEMSLQKQVVGEVYICT